MATERLYLSSIKAAYSTSFSAIVQSVEGKNIVLDRTLFYPLGGGQDWDCGILEGPNGAVKVTEVTGRGEIQHTVEQDHQLQAGDEVKGSIDWERRHKHMRMHTAQHLVSGIAYELFNGTKTVGNKLRADQSRIDFNPISFDESMLNKLTTNVNNILDENHTVTDSTMTREEINTIMPPERTNMGLLPSSVKQLRVVKIGESIDLCPCAGTHVQQLSEIGHINILGKKSKGKGTQRVTYDLKIPEVTPSPDIREI